MTTTISSPAPDWVVHCDFDGTISTTDVTDSLLERFGREGWRELEARWQRGEIGSRECMQRQVALLAMTADELDAHLATIAIDPHFAAFVAAARDAGMPVLVSSDGLDRAILPLLARAGLAALPLRANRLVSTGPRHWQLLAPHARPGCARAAGNCKCAHAQAAQARASRVLYIGDGSSDFCVAGRADFVLAKDRLLAFCRQRGLPHRAITGFGDALGWLHDEHLIRDAG